MPLHAYEMGTEQAWLAPAPAAAPRLQREPVLYGGSMPAGELEERLISAAAEGNIKNVKTLLAEGARPNAQSVAGARALHAAVTGGHWEISRLLLKQGADPNAGDIRGRTPLELAVVHHREKLLDLLLRSKSDTERKNSLGNTPLITALLLEREIEARQLIDAGARLDIQSGDKRCLAELAAAHVSENLVNLIFERGGQAACQ